MRFPMRMSHRALVISGLVLAAVGAWIGVFTAIAVWDVGRFTSFWAPQRLAAAWPDVYDQLRAFYRQDPLNGS
mgnify:CR=1 FL=1